MPTILVVEDNAASRRPLTQLLKQEGYQVFAAADAFEATAMVRNHHPDLMLLDVGIPPVDGLTMLMLLQLEGHGHTCPVILVTAACDDNTATRAQQLGVKAHLVKSQFQPAELLALVKQHLQSASAKPQAG